MRAKHTDARAIGAGVWRLAPFLRLLRPEQWVKNGFVLAPLFFTPGAVTPKIVLVAMAGFACFSAAASAGYVLNDWYDRAEDRGHPAKRDRPLASGAVTPSAALGVAFGLLLGALAGASLLSNRFLALLVAYVALSGLYSAVLRRHAIIDVLTVSLGFVLRVLAGAALAGVAASVWILACTGLLALAVALGKRHDDVQRGRGGAKRPSLAGYNLRFLDTSVAVVLGALLVAYVMYTIDPAVIARGGGRPLIATIPFVVGGILRYLQIMLVEKKTGAPTELALRDPGLRLAALGWLAVFALLLYLP
ncbi:MAG: prenyltransferase [Alphaproteobacteria bacterium]|nr:prenyltransferase [Alphaproteobacteria bacterium]